MVEIPLPLPTQSVIGRDGEAANARVINAYPEQVESGGKAPYVLYGAPGLTQWSRTVYPGAERGMIQLDDAHILAVLGNQVVTFDTSGYSTVIGAITGTGRVTMAIDREQPHKAVAIITSDGLYYLVTGGSTVTLQSLAGLPPPNSATYLAGRFIFGIKDARLFCSGLDDGTTVSAAGYDTANLNPDDLVRAYAYSSYIYAFGEKTIELWQPDAALANYPFPYSNTRATITLGLMSAQSVAELDDGLVWVDDQGIVRYGVGAGSARISTHSVERAISNLSAAQQDALTGCIIQWEGHKCYVLSSALWTWVYDLRTQSWVERRSSGMTRWRVSNAIQFNGLTICGDVSTGILYSLDTDEPTENGDPLEMEISCGVIHRFPGYMIVDRLAVDVVAGLALQTGDLADTDPQLLVDWSDDGGKTFQNELSAPLGKIGEFDKPVEFRALGMFRQKGRIIRLKSTVKALKCIMQASLDVRPAR